MFKTNGRIGLLLGVLVPIAGCATVDPRLDYEHAGQYVTEATGQEHVYQPGDDELSARLVAELLRDGITADEAAAVCLLNSPTLQAAFMDIGMARADVVQAGLLSNPSLGIALQLPSGGGLANLQAGLAQNIADLWQIPARRRAAQRSLDQTVLGLARQAADLAADAKVAYYEAVGADQRLEILLENLAVAQNLLDLARTRKEAGAASQLDVNLSRSVALDAELELEAARLAAADARRALATLLGITTDAQQITLLDSVEDVPQKVPDAERLVEIARTSRLDIRWAEQAVRAAEARLREEYRRVFPTIELGVALERGERGPSDGGRDILADTARASIVGRGLTAPEIQPRSERRRNTDFIIGPSLNLELPIFDQNRAQIAKARFACEQANKTLEAVVRAAVQEVHSAVDRALTAWKLVRMYRDRSIPLAQSNLELSRQAYRAGRTSILAVLEAQRFFLDTRNGYVDAAKTAATTAVELERAIGLPFSKLVAEVDGEPAPDVGPREDKEP